jgi:CRISPR-associated exonuclease Cas4
MENTPQIAVDIIKWKIEQTLKHGNRRNQANVYYVTDLEKCAMRRWFETRLPELGIIRALNGRLLFGDIVHVGILTILKKIYGERIVTELDDEEAVSAERTIVIDGIKYIISGRIDAILDKTIGIEIKSNVSPPETPLPVPWHVTQARAYNWLFNLQKTRLIYVTPHGIFQYEVETPISEEEIKRIIRSEKSPKYSWECKTCEFSSICPIFRLKKEKEVNNNEEGS